MDLITALKDICNTSLNWVSYKVCVRQPSSNTSSIQQDLLFAFSVHKLPNTYYPKINVK